MPRREQHPAQVVRERDRRKLRVMVLGVGIAAGVLGFVLGYVALKVNEVRMSYKIDDLRVLRNDLEEFNRQLRLELATLKSLSRIETVARNELGFTRPERDQIVVAREFVGEEGARGSLRTAWEEQIGPTGPRVP